MTCPKERREELYTAIVLHQLSEKIRSIAPEKHIKAFADALMQENEETIKTQFHSLIQCVTQHKGNNIPFHQQSPNGLPHCLETLSLLDLQWIKKLNSGLDLGLEESQLSSFEIIKQSFEQYIEKASKLKY